MKGCVEIKAKLLHSGKDTDYKVTDIPLELKHVVKESSFKLDSSEDTEGKPCTQPGKHIVMELGAETIIHTLHTYLIVRYPNG